MQGHHSRDVITNITSASQLVSELQLAQAQHGVAVLDIYNAEWGHCKCLSETFRRLYTDAGNVMYLRFYAVECGAVLRSLAEPEPDRKHVSSTNHARNYCVDTTPAYWADVVRARQSHARPFFMFYKEGSMRGHMEGIDTPRICKLVGSLCSQQAPAANYLTNPSLLRFWEEQLAGEQSEVTQEQFVQAVNAAHLATGAEQEYTEEEMHAVVAACAGAAAARRSSLGGAAFDAVDTTEEHEGESVPAVRNHSRVVKAADLQAWVGAVGTLNNAVTQLLDDRRRNSQIAESNGNSTAYPTPSATPRKDHTSGNRSRKDSLTAATASSASASSTRRSSRSARGSAVSQTSRRSSVHETSGSRRVSRSHGSQLTRADGQLRESDTAEIQTSIASMADANSGVGQKESIEEHVGDDHTSIDSPTHATDSRAEVSRHRLSSSLHVNSPLAASDDAATSEGAKSVSQVYSQQHLHRTSRSVADGEGRSTGPRVRDCDNDADAEAAHEERGEQLKQNPNSDTQHSAVVLDQCAQAARDCTVEAEVSGNGNELNASDIDVDEKAEQQGEHIVEASNDSNAEPDVLQTDDTQASDKRNNRSSSGNSFAADAEEANHVPGPREKEIYSTLTSTPLRAPESRVNAIRLYPIDDNTSTDEWVQNMLQPFDQNGAADMTLKHYLLSQGASWNDVQLMCTIADSRILSDNLLYGKLALLLLACGAEERAQLLPAVSRDEEQPPNDSVGFHEALCDNELLASYPALAFVTLCLCVSETEAGETFYYVPPSSASSVLRERTEDEIVVLSALAPLTTSAPPCDVSSGSGALSGRASDAYTVILSGLPKVIELTTSSESSLNLEGANDAGVLLNQWFAKFEVEESTEMTLRLRFVDYVQEKLFTETTQTLVDLLLDDEDEMEKLRRRDGQES